MLPSRKSPQVRFHSADFIQFIVVSEFVQKHALSGISKNLVMACLVMVIVMKQLIAFAENYS